MDFKVKKGCDIRLSGAVEKAIVDLSPERVAYTLTDFPYLKSKVLVKEGDRVKLGSPLFMDKKNPEVQFVSPAAGTVEAIVRGERRLLLKVVIKVDGDDAVEFAPLDETSVAALDVDGAKQALLERGLWPLISRRPFLKTPDPKDEPSSIFISCLDSNPLAGDPNFYLDGRKDDFQAGVSLLAKISPNVHVCKEGNGEASETFNVEGGQSHRFSGPHPRSNPSVHIENLDPVVSQSKVVWTLRAQEVVAIGRTLRTGRFDNERVVAWAGPAAEKRQYYRTLMGASLATLPTNGDVVRRVSGSVFTGRKMDEQAFLGCFDNTVLALEEDERRQVLGWLDPGVSAHSLTRCYLTSIAPKGDYAMTTTSNGEHRAIVDSEMYDRVQPLDIHTAFLFKSLLAEDIEESERQGLWSVAPEDMALATYMDPSKNDFAAPLVKVLDILHKEEG